MSTACIVDDMVYIPELAGYLDRLTLPKYVVNAAGDQFFTPDSSRFYFDDLKGPKYLRYVPNGDHSLRGTDAADGILLASEHYDSSDPGACHCKWLQVREADDASRLSRLSALLPYGFLRSDCHNDRNFERSATITG